MKTCRCNEPAEAMQNPDTKPPTPIDPADIRPGDVVERRDVGTVSYISQHGPVRAPLRPVTWHLVSRHDPDAEAVDALILAASTDSDGNPDYDRTTPEKILSRLREQGWDVTRRAES